MIQGHFIVLEGIDGSGTTTQATKIKDEFSKRGLPAHVTAEPSSGPVGALIRQVLTGRLVIRNHEAALSPSWKSMALLFAADRQDHIEAEISPNLHDGVNIICDRYLYSSVIYQSLSTNNEDAEKWIIEINKHYIKPDLVLNFEIDPKQALSRRNQRNDKDEIFDDPDFQNSLALAYKNLSTMFPDTNIATINCNQSIEEVTNDCWKHIENLRVKGAP